jgi:hypothetical protein
MDQSNCDSDNNIFGEHPLNLKRLLELLVDKAQYDVYISKLVRNRRFWNRLCQLQSKSKITLYLENKERKYTL